MHWSEVDSYKHLEADLADFSANEPIIPKASTLARKFKISDDELETIMLRTYGPIRRKSYSEPKIISSQQKENKHPASIISLGFDIFFKHSRHVLYPENQD